MTFECPICYQQRRKKITLQCDHEFCQKCWKQWSTREQFFSEEHYPVCPTCRHPQVCSHARSKTGDWKMVTAAILFFWWWTTHTTTS